MLFLVRQILRIEPKLKAPAFDMHLPITLSIACSVPCAIHALFQETNVAQHQRPFCPPLAIVPAQVSEPFA